MFSLIVAISVCSIVNARSISTETGEKIIQKNSVVKQPFTSTNQYKDFVQRSLNPIDTINRNGIVHKIELKRRLEMKKTTVKPEVTSQSAKDSIPDSFFSSFHWGPQGK